MAPVWGPSNRTLPKASATQYQPILRTGLADSERTGRHWPSGWLGRCCGRSDLPLAEESLGRTANRITSIL